VAISGLVNTSVQVGGAIGLAVLATLASQRTTSRLADGGALERLALEPLREPTGYAAPSVLVAAGRRWRA
jgi:hypothetical protein